MRVGRCGKKCERYPTRGTEFFDRSLNQAFIKRLIDFETKLQQDGAIREPKMNLPDQARSKSKGAKHEIDDQNNVI